MQQQRLSLKNLFSLKNFGGGCGGGGVFKKEEKKSERKTCSFSLLLFLWGKKLFLSPLAAKAS
jgi:hypothetical protein